MSDKSLSFSEKTKQSLGILFKVTALFAFLYLFICALGFLSDAFKLVGGKAAGQAFRESDLLSNPVAGLMIGVLTTVLLQSSSTTTSIIITMVGSGIIPIQTAIPMVMGANIGTSITNTIVSLAQSGDREEFRKAFSGATVHDMFNWCTVLVLLPIELLTHYLYHLTGAIVQSLNFSHSSTRKQDILKIITKPFTSLIVKINKRVITDIALQREAVDNGGTVLKRWCQSKLVPHNATVQHSKLFNTSSDGLAEMRKINRTSFNITMIGLSNRNLGSAVNVTTAINNGVRLEWSTLEIKNRSVHIKRCSNLFAMTDWTDDVIGIILLVVALVLIVVALIMIVKILNSLLKGSVAKVVKRTINADFPGKLAFMTGYVAILVGTGMTMIIQSSSVFTSTLTPLVGVGVVSLDRMYPLSLGANVGTCLTGILAALAAPSNELPHTLQISLCHMFFNITGVLIFYPIPCMRKGPIGLAKILGNTTGKYRWFSILYMLTMFFLLPGSVFALSLSGTTMLLAVGVPVLTFVFLVAIINLLQRKAQQFLPPILRNWDFLPVWMHSLDPLDKGITKVTAFCNQCKKQKKRTTEGLVLRGHVNKGFEGVRL